MNKKKLSLVIFLLAVLIFPYSVRSHEGSFKDAGSLPPIGPHGGKILKLTRHIAEVAVTANSVEVYILERDAKTVAADATAVSITVALPGKSPEAIRLLKKGDGYSGAYRLTPTARRITFTVRCVLDGKSEIGTLQYEPRK